MELAAGVSMYETISSFFGGQTRAQDPIYSLQGHVLYHFRSGIWAALDMTYYTGGRTTIDGVEGNDLQKTFVWARPSRCP